MARPPRSNHTEDSAEAFGRILARIRKERGYTQSELAEKVGTLQVGLSDYERGKVRPNADMVVRLAKALEVSADELLGLDPPSEPKPAPTQNRRLLRRLRKIDALSKRDQEALLRTIDAFLAKSTG